MVEESFKEFVCFNKSEVKEIFLELFLEIKKLRNTCFFLVDKSFELWSALRVGEIWSELNHVGLFKQGMFFLLFREVSHDFIVFANRKKKD